MRSLVVLLLACGVAEAQPGVCPRPAPSPYVLPAKSFEVTQDLSTVRPMRKSGFTSFEVAYSREARSRGLHTWLEPSISGGKLQLSQRAQSCHDTGAGCSTGYWSSPAHVVFVDPKPVSGCIAYAFELPAGMVVGIGREVRTFLRNDTGTVAGPAVRAPDLDVLDVIDGVAVLTEADGTLWTARWDATAAPVLTKVAKVPARPLAATRSNHGLIYVFADAGLFAFDAKTFALRWKVDGDVKGTMSIDVPLTHFVLTVEPGPAPKVVLRMLDSSGTETRRRTVYDGPFKDAYLERSGEYVRPDLYQGILLVHIVK